MGLVRAAACSGPGLGPRLQQMLPVVSEVLQRCMCASMHACKKPTQGSGSSRVSGSGSRGHGPGWSTHPGSTLSHARRCCREMFSAMERHCKVCDRPCAQACQICPALQHLLGNDTTARLSYCGAFLQRCHSPTQLQRESHIPHSSATPAHTRQLKMDPNARCTGEAWPP